MKKPVNQRFSQKQLINSFNKGDGLALLMIFVPRTLPINSTATHSIYTKYPFPVFNQDIPATCISHRTSQSIRQYQATGEFKKDTIAHVTREAITINTLRIGANDLKGDSFGDRQINEIILKDSGMTNTGYQNVGTDQRNYYEL